MRSAIGLAHAAEHRVELGENADDSDLTFDAVARLVAGIGAPAPDSRCRVRLHDPPRHETHTLRECEGLACTREDVRRQRARLADTTTGEVDPEIDVGLVPRGIEGDVVRRRRTSDKQGTTQAPVADGHAHAHPRSVIPRHHEARVRGLGRVAQALLRKPLTRGRPRSHGPRRRIRPPRIALGIQHRHGRRDRVRARRRRRRGDGRARDRRSALDGSGRTIAARGCGDGQQQVTRSNDHGQGFRRSDHGGVARIGEPSVMAQ